MARARRAVRPQFRWLAAKGWDRRSDIGDVSGKSRRGSGDDTWMHRGRAAGGVGGGVETKRSYLAEDFPTGSERSVMRWLKTLLGRDDVVRIWLRPVDSKDVIWHHDGPLDELPELGSLFESGDAVEDSDPESGDSFGIAA